MLSLVRRDPTLRMAPKWILVGAITSAALAGLRAYMITARTLQTESLHGSPHFGDVLLLVLAMWIPLAVFLAFGRVGQRCSRFDLVMPVSAGRLWSAHWVGVLLSGSSVLAASVGVLVLHEQVLIQLPRYTTGARGGMGGLVLVAAAGMILVAAMLQAQQPSLYRVRIDSRRRWFVVASLLFGLAVTLGLSTLPLAAALAPVALALVLMIRSYRAVPPGLTLVPATTDAAAVQGTTENWSAVRRPVASAAAGTSGSLRDKLRLDAAVLRVLMLGIAPGQMLRIPANLLGIPFLFGMGLLLSGFVIRYDVLRFTNITLTVYMLVAFLGGPMVQLYILDPLPISRRRVFALMMLPNLLVIALGYGAGRVGLERVEPVLSIAYGSEGSSQLVPQRRSTVARVRVPKENFVIAWDGRPPQNSSPWGESHDAWQVPLFKGSRAVIYSPFSAEENHSADFVALQISRAVETIYGESIAYEEIRDRYLETSPEGVVLLKGERGLSLLSDYPGLVARVEGPAFPVVMLLTGLLWFAFASIYFRFQRASTSERGKKLVFFGMMGAALLLHMLQFVGFIAGLIEDWVAVGMLELSINWLVRTLPGGNVAVWVLCALLFGLGYRLARSAFERVEVSAPKTPAE